MFIWTILNYLLQRLEHPKEFIAPHITEVVYYYAFFLLVDLLAASVGFTFERKENWKLLAWLPFQRFGYRQVMYSVMIRSVKNAFKGSIVGWNKVERKATVTEMI
jgi:membrane protease YdiL (CAAX protease family)